MSSPPFRKLLVANRGEIAVRIFRACTELGIRTVAIHSREDLHSVHRYKADEAYEVGRPGDPIGSYLDAGCIIDLARRKHVEAIHPGYGFLAENPGFASACHDAGLVFVGPPASVIEQMGDKNAARRLAARSGVPTIPGLDGPASSAADVRAFARSAGLPIIIKASHGGGGRGMRIVREERDIDSAFRRAASEARSAFGRPEVFAEKLIERARHIEVQILGDEQGDIVHLFERDCSIQRRHQKIVEVAPAAGIEPPLARALAESALAVARSCGYVNAGTVEFLVAGDEFYFLEVNPRLQVEHTVTEMVTGLDLVQAMIHVAAGRRLADPEIGIAGQEYISCRGVAAQCRITTEDPENDFVPDTGRIGVYRSAAGFGIRLDSGTGGAGSEITPYYDSLIVKVTGWAPTLAGAAAKLRRSLMEFRIRGVKTNIPFLLRVLEHPTFMSGRAQVDFVESTKELFVFPRRRDRASRTLRGIADIVVNGPPGMKDRPRRPSPPIEAEIPVVAAGTPGVSPARQTLDREGPEALSRWIVSQKRLLITDTTFRDAHQSLLATRVRTADLTAIAPATAHLAPGLFSHEMWGGATFDVCLRFLKEDPWERLVELRARLPNVLFQMLLRGANAVGYANYPDEVVRAFIRESAAAGIDVFRIFDALNYIPNMELSIAEVVRAGKVAEAAVCYTGDVLTDDKYHLQYYVDLALEMQRRGAHVVAIKDMAGLLKPRAARVLVDALKQQLDVPLHLHTHDTSGNGIATYLEAAGAGVDIVDCALSSMSGLTSQPSLNALVAALKGAPRDPGLDEESLQKLASYWERVRDLYHPFESGLRAGTAEVYVHEIPGGQYSNLRPQAIGLGLGDRWELIKQRYREVDRAFGRVIKVTPTSKVVGDMAMFLVANHLTMDDVIERGAELDLPRSVVDFFRGALGLPHGGFPERLRRAVLRGDPPPERDVPRSVDLEGTGQRLRETMDREPTGRDVLSAALYPQIHGEYVAARRQFGDLSRLNTRVFLYGLEPNEETVVEIEEGKRLVVELLAVGDARPDGTVDVYFELNGMLREVTVFDRSRRSNPPGRGRRADPSVPGQVASPMRGKVVSVEVAPGDRVVAGDRLLVTEAMKVETAISAPVAGKVAAVEVAAGDVVEAGDLVAIVETE